MSAVTIAMRRSTWSASAPAGSANSSQGSVTAKVTRRPARGVGQGDGDQRQRDLDQPVGEVGQGRGRPQLPERLTEAARLLTLAWAIDHVRHG